MATSHHQPVPVPSRRRSDADLLEALLGHVERAFLTLGAHGAWRTRWGIPWENPGNSMGAWDFTALQVNDIETDWETDQTGGEWCEYGKV